MQGSLPLLGKRHYYNQTGEDEIRFNKSVDAGVGLKSRGLLSQALDRGFPSHSMVKNPPANAGDVGSIPEWGRPPEKEMATHSSILAWKIPWTEEPGGLQSMGSQKSQTRLGDDNTRTHTGISSVGVQDMLFGGVPEHSDGETLGRHRVYGQQGSAITPRSEGHREEVGYGSGLRSPHGSWPVGA